MSELVLRRLPRPTDPAITLFLVKINNNYYYEHEKV